jgi:hypothetical protein
MRCVGRCLSAFSVLFFAPVIATTAEFKPVTEEMLLNPDPTDWLMISRTYDEQDGARDVVGILRGAVSGKLMVLDQAARSIG